MEYLVTLENDFLPKDLEKSVTFFQEAVYLVEKETVPRIDFR